jgi:DNA repair exonuclease SbcCD ATPase subunit
LSRDGDTLLGTTVIVEDVTEHRLLQSELEFANRQLETAYEELRSTNEELETTNEELQSTVEELETMNEELQSMNGWTRWTAAVGRYASAAPSAPSSSCPVSVVARWC